MFQIELYFGACQTYRMTLFPLGILMSLLQNEKINQKLDLSV